MLLKTNSPAVISRAGDNTQKDQDVIAELLPGHCRPAWVSLANYDNSKWYDLAFRTRAEAAAARGFFLKENGIAKTEEFIFLRSRLSERRGGCKNSDNWARLMVDGVHATTSADALQTARLRACEILHVNRTQQFMVLEPALSNDVVALVNGRPVKKDAVSDDKSYTWRVYLTATTEQVARKIHSGMFNTPIASDAILVRGGCNTITPVKCIPNWDRARCDRCRGTLDSAERSCLCGYKTLRIEHRKEAISAIHMLDIAEALGARTDQLSVGNRFGRGLGTLQKWCLFMHPSDAKVDEILTEYIESGIITGYHVGDSPDHANIAGCEACGQRDAECGASDHVEKHRRGDFSKCPASRTCPDSVKDLGSFHAGRKSGRNIDAHPTRHNDEKESERTDDTAGVIPDDLRTDRSERDDEHGHARARKNQEAKTDEPRTDAGGHMTTDLTDPDHAISDASACAPFQTIVKPGDNGDANTEMDVDATDCSTATAAYTATSSAGKASSEATTEKNNHLASNVGVNTGDTTATTSSGPYARECHTQDTSRVVTSLSTLSISQRGSSANGNADSFSTQGNLNTTPPPDPIHRDGAPV